MEGLGGRGTTCSQQQTVVDTPENCLELPVLALALKITQNAKEHKSTAG